MFNCQNTTVHDLVNDLKKLIEGKDRLIRNQSIEIGNMKEYIRKLEKEVRKGRETHG